MLLRKIEEIETWLNKYNINYYEIISDKEYGYVVNVDANVDISNRNLKSIDVKFNEINGYFDCSDNFLNSLEGCPEYIESDFYCNNNNFKIKELDCLPKKINNDYIEIYSNNKLGKLQNIRSFKELKEKVEEIFKIKKEKETLLKNINKKELHKNNIINKI